MALIDSQGRVLGRLNAIDAAALLLGLILGVPTLIYAASLTMVWATALRVHEITPDRVVERQPTELVVVGDNLDSVTRVEVGSRPTADATHLGGNRLVINVPGTLLPGGYPLTLVNRWGKAVTIPNGVVVTPADIIYEDVPVLALCVVLTERIKGSPEVEAHRLQAQLHSIMDVRPRHEPFALLTLQARLVVSPASRDYFIGEHPLGIGTSLYFTDWNQQVHVRTVPVPLVEPKETH